MTTPSSGLIAKFALLGALTAMAASAQAATVDYIQFTQNGAPIKGSSTADGHANWSTIDSFNWGVTIPFNPTGTTGGGSGKPTFSNFSWTQELDAAFTPLFTAATAGRALNAEIDFTSNNRGESVSYFKMEFTGAHITELGLAGTAQPLETGAFAYNKIEFLYYQQNPDGSLSRTPLTASYDLVKNVGNVAQLGALYAAALGPQALPPAVPEPDAIAMLLGGLGMIGLLARRQSQRRG